MMKRGFTPLQKVINRNSNRNRRIAKGVATPRLANPVRKNSLKGFTLLEVLIVVIIIGILATIALPQYIRTLEKARSSEAVANVGSIRASLDRYWYQVGSITTDLGQVDIDNPNDVTNKLYTYAVTDDGTTSSIRKYTVTATRTVGTETYTVTWIQTDNETGKLYRSANLGGPTPP